MIATRDLRQASLFFVVPTDDGENQYEFLIAHYGDTGLAPKNIRRRSSGLSNPSVFDLPPVGRYLAAPLSTFGKNPGPLFLRSSVSQTQCRFVIHHRLSHQSKKGLVADLATWTLSRDVFFINCSRRKFKRDGYLCVKAAKGGRRGIGSDVHYMACVPSLKEHNDRDTFMLFRLLPSSVRVQGLFTPVTKRPIDETDTLFDRLSRLDEEEEGQEAEASERLRKESARLLATAEVHEHGEEHHSLTILKSD